MLALKILLKTAFHLLKNPNGRYFLYIASRFGAKKRYASFQIKWQGKHFHIPDALSFIWQYHEIFVNQSYHFDCQKSEPIIYDCGANIGLSTLYFKELYPNAKVKLFEASPEVAQVLQENLKNQALSNLEIHSKAVWINNDGLELQLEGADASSLYGEGQSTKVSSVRLRDLLAEETEVDFLKMDIEGAEVEVLADAADMLKKVNQLFVEYHAYEGYTQRLPELLTVLSSANFRYFIQTESERKQPFINRESKNPHKMDLQLNIFAYRL